MKKILFFSLILSLFGNIITAQSDNKTTTVKQLVQKFQSGLPNDISSRSADQIASDIVSILPKYQDKKTEITRLAQLTLDIASGKSTSVNAKAISKASTSSIEEELLKAYLQQAGINVEDWEFVSTTLLPLYTYTMTNRDKLPAQAYLNYTLDTAYRAPIDGCYYALGDERNTYDPTGLSNAECNACTADGGKTKINGAYPWGMVMTKERMFWGTVNNILCMPSWQSMTSMGAGSNALVEDYGYGRCCS